MTARPSPTADSLAMAPKELRELIQGEAPASWPRLTETDVVPFARDLDRLRNQKRAVDFAERCGEQGSAEDRRDSVRKALRTLLDELPTMIERQELVSVEVDHAEAVLRGCGWLWQNAGFEDRPRRSEKTWGAGARYLADRVIRIWEGAGQSNVSHQTPCGPVLSVVEKLLRHVDGTRVSQDTLAQELRRRPPSVKLKL